MIVPSTQCYDEYMRRLISFFGTIAILIVIFGTMYAVTQRMLRTDANTPQIQLAEDTAANLNANIAPATMTHEKVDIAKSLAPFVNIYDQSGKIIAGSGYLDGTLIAPPKGVLTASDTAAYHAVTWQPRPDTRIAAVTVHSDKYYVLSGRSLKEVEKNEDYTLFLTLAGGKKIEIPFQLIVVFSTNLNPATLADAASPPRRPRVACSTPGSPCAKPACKKQYPLPGACVLLPD